jgi:hypothetical protein
MIAPAALRMARGRQPRDVDDVLDPDRNPVQRPAQPPLRRLGLGGASLFQRRVRVDTEKRVEARIQPLDPIEERLDELHGGHLATRDRCRRRIRGHPVQFTHLQTTTMGGHGSDAVPLDRRILSVAFDAEIAAAATSSGNSSNAFSRPARRAIASNVLSSIAAIPLRSDAIASQDMDTTKRVIMSVLSHTADVERHAEKADRPVLQKAPSSAHSRRLAFTAATSPCDQAGTVAEGDRGMNGLRATHGRLCFTSKQRIKEQRRQ